ncbi:MAG TPA: VIT domain-containing protein, partial [Phycisphaerae bacterium]|nr:VIT domain-containing protein [Phycisphaerae bacterium]
MPEDFDTYDENLSRLLRGAQVPPALSDDRRQAMLRDLQEQLDRAAQARRKTTMRRWIASAASLAAAAVVVIGLVLSGGRGPDRPGKQPSGPAVRLADGTRLIARGQSNYTVVGDRRVRLEAGQLLLLVARADRPFVVETPQVRAEAKGTIFTVSTDETGSRVAVGQGRVGVTNPQGAVEVRRGEQAFAAPGSAPRRSPAPRFSHQVNWAREHLGGEVPIEAEAPRPAGELVAFDPWGRQVRLELRKFHVDVVIEDGIARTTVDQTFFNQVSWQLEGTFTFPLPPDASLSRLAMYVGCDLNEGGMVEREYGRYVYETIVYSRRDPALLEMMEGNVFKMRVFPIFGRQEKRVLLSYTQTLPELYRTLRYWFPMDHGNDKAQQVSVRVRVKDAAGRYEAASSTHEVQTREDGADLLIEHEAGNVAPNQDFLLNLTPAAGRGEALTVRHCVQDGATYVFARWRPELTGQVEPRPRQWFFINDVSASRSSVDVRAQAYVIERLLAEADDQDAFALVNLDTRVRPWRTELTGVHDPQAVSATAFADVSERMGATDLAAALRAVGEMIARSGADNPHIVYLGDGIATDAETRTDRLVAALPEGATFLGLGVGKKIDARFLQAAADATGGLFAPINPGEDVRWRVFDLVAALNTPRLVHVDVAFLDAAGKPMAAAAHPSSGCLSDGEALTVLAQTGNVLPARMIVLGESRGRPFRQDFDLSVSRGEAAFIPRLWAAARINHLLREDADAHKAEIVALSKAFYVVTPFTSLIVLENEADYKRWNVEMGRKDHWQLYPAPKKIPIVHEPLEHGAWEVPAAAMKGAPGHPKTVEEIVESVQFRVHVPLYGYHPYQRRRVERFALQELLSGRGMAAAHGVVSPVLPILVDDEEEDELRIGTGKTGAWEWGTEAQLGLDFKSHVSTRLSGPATLGSFSTELRGRGAVFFLGGDLLPMSLELSSSGFVSGGDVALRLIRPDLTEESMLTPDVPMLRGMASGTTGTWGEDFYGRLTVLSQVMRESHVKSPPILDDQWAQPGFLAPALDADVNGLFRQSRFERWSEERQRVRAYNRRFGGWY